MLSNFIIFRIYLCFAILVLLPICYFITLELLDHIKYYSIALKNLNSEIAVSENSYDMYFLFNYLFKRQQWFKCVIMLQFFNYYQSVNTNKLLGMCFHSLSYYYLAVYHYNAALKSGVCIEILKNLAVVYKDLNNHKMLKQTCAQISTINPDDTFLLGFD